MKDIPQRENFLLPITSLQGFSVEDATSWTKHNVFAVFHFLNHERLSTLYYRIYEKTLTTLHKSRADPAVGGRSDDVPTTPPYHDDHMDIDSNLREVRTNIFLSARRVSQMVKGLQSRDLLRYIPSFV